MDGLLAVPGHLLEDGPAGWIGKGFEDVARCSTHAKNHNYLVMVLSRHIQDSFAVRSFSIKSAGDPLNDRKADNDKTLARGKSG